MSFSLSSQERELREHWGTGLFVLPTQSYGIRFQEKNRDSRTLNNFKNTLKTHLLRLAFIFTTSLELILLIYLFIYLDLAIYIYLLFPSSFFSFHSFTF